MQGNSGGGDSELQCGQQCSAGWLESSGSRALGREPWPLALASLSQPCPHSLDCSLSSYSRRVAPPQAVLTDRPYLLFYQRVAPQKQGAQQAAAAQHAGPVKQQ